MERYRTLLPVTLITGFLGSGKTTLLSRLLASPKLADTAVLINEFGEISLDHLLLEQVDADTVVLQSGCICCTIRTDLARAMRDLYDKRERGTIRPFRRVAIETTGLADPAPIVSTLSAEPVLRHHFRLGKVVTTVDAVNASMHLERHRESVKQVALADRLLVTKCDLVAPGVLPDLERRLRRLNASAPIVRSGAKIDPDDLLRVDLYDSRAGAREVRHWLAAAAAGSEATTAGGEAGLSHHERAIASWCAIFDEPLDWTMFGLWLTMLLNRHGDRILRVKGLLSVAGAQAPVVIHGVQHIVHPPVHLRAWPDDDHRSRIVFITDGLDPREIERSLGQFAMGARAPRQSVRRSAR